MAYTPTQQRFTFLAEALDGTGGFAPDVIYGQMDGLLRPLRINGHSHIVPHPRESAEKYAARVACATYENHLRSACERFTSYLARKSPSRANTDNPLVAQFMTDADDAGNPLDVVLHSLTLATKARGTMLVLIDMPSERTDTSFADTLNGLRRAIPYITPIAPELVRDYTLDDRGRLNSVGIASTHTLPDGQVIDVTRRWDAHAWSVWHDKNLIAQGPHPFGACPVLALTENGAAFPQVGKFAQIADLSKRLYNCAAETDDILRSQTFSVLAVQVPPETSHSADVAQSAAATIGTHSLLIHQGQTPAFIAPDSGPAQTYLARTATLQAAIDRIGMDTASQPGQQQESGVARKMRFEALNADLASFARLLQALETRLWALFHHALGLQNRVEVTYPTDYHLTDSAAELDILALMQATGHPEAVLREKRRAIVQAEFDRADPDTLAQLMAALDEQAQAGAMA